LDDAGVPLESNNLQYDSISVHSSVSRYYQTCITNTSKLILL